MKTRSPFQVNRLRRIASSLQCRKLPGSPLLFLLPLWALARPALGAPLTVDDADGALGRTEAPVTSLVRLRKNQAAAARLGRLGLAGRLNLLDWASQQARLRQPAERYAVDWQVMGWLAALAQIFRYLYSHHA